MSLDEARLRQRILEELLHAHLGTGDLIDHLTEVLIQEHDRSCPPPGSVYRDAYRLLYLQELERFQEEVEAEEATNPTMVAIRAIRADAVKMVARRIAAVGVAPRPVMIRVGGKRFVCECGASVQTEDPETGHFTCNGCGTVYEGALAEEPHG